VLKSEVFECGKTGSSFFLRTYVNILKHLVGKPVVCCQIAEAVGSPYPDKVATRKHSGVSGHLKASVR